MLKLFHHTDLELPPSVWWQFWRFQSCPVLEVLTQEVWDTYKWRLSGLEQEMVVS